jgi:hypothetical protein
MTATTRSAPAGTKLDEGFPAKIAFAADSDVSFWEKSVKPPGVDGGDAVETTTMFNTTYRTRGPRVLKTLTDAQLTVAYDPQVLDQIIALINVNGWISVHFSDGSCWNFVGYLKSFEPNEMQEGNQPEAAITIVATNQLAGVETLAEYSATGSGT